MHNDISEILFTEKQLADRVGEIGAAITSDYADVADEGIILISVLRGAAIFMADLARKIELPLEMDYMAISSYGNGAKSVRRGAYPERPLVSNRRASRQSWPRTSSTPVLP